MCVWKQVEWPELSGHLPSCARKDVCLTSSAPRWQHDFIPSPSSLPVCRQVMDCPGLSILFPAAIICRHLCCPSCLPSLSLLPLPLLLPPYFSAFPQRGLASAATEIACSGQQARPPTSFWVQPQDHWPVVAVFTPQFCVDKSSTWQKFFFQLPFHFCIWHHLGAVRPWGPEASLYFEAGTDAISERTLTSLFCGRMLAISVPLSKESLDYCGLLWRTNEVIRI